MNSSKAIKLKAKGNTVLKKQVKPMLKKNAAGSIPAWAIGAVLVLTAIIYFRLFNNGFITCWDDDGYILKNPYLRDFSLKGIAAIFSNFYYSNYHPLTTLTYLFEYKLYGLNPLPYHVFNVILHLFNTFLVYRLVEKLSGKSITALIVAALFALHPMHVESVAWISERKDVLYTFFYLLSLLMYLQYINSGSKKKYYLFALLLFIGSLLSKPAAVTLPVLLIAIDIYRSRKINMQFIIEKIPFLLLSLLFGILTILSQKEVNAFTAMTNSYDLIDRIFLFTYSIVFYIVKLVVPFGLSAMHYYPQTNGGVLPWMYYASLPLLLVMIGLIIWKTKFRKEILFGAFFFLITISVMLQIVPVGRAHMSERYTYFPYIGLSFIAAQMITGINKRQLKNIFFAVIILIVVVFSYQTWDRIAIWKDGNALFSDVINKNPVNYHGYYVRASLRSSEGDIQGAIEDYNKAIRFKPDFAVGFVNRGDLLNKTNDYYGAIEDLNHAIHLDSTVAFAYLNRGVAHDATGNTKSAMHDYNKAIKLDPGLARAYNNKGILEAKSGDTTGALIDFNMSVKIAPEDPDSYSNRGSFKNAQKDYKGAIEDFNYAVKLKPDNNMVYYNRGIVYMNLNEMTDACADWRKAAELGNTSAQQMINQYCK